MNTIRIRNAKSRAVRTVQFEGFLGKTRAWFQVRFPGGAGVYDFSLVHGFGAKVQKIQDWHVDPTDLETVREEARKEGVKFKVLPLTVPGQRPRSPCAQSPADPRQTEWCK
jgi:hypothetical protein